MPDLRSLPRTLIRGHPEGFEETGFRLEFISTKIGAEMTPSLKFVNLTFILNLSLNLILCLLIFYIFYIFLSSSFTRIPLMKRLLK